MQGIGRMDERVLQQIRTFWPDVAGPFSRVVPDGIVLARSTDDWRPGVRLRGLEFARGEQCPEIDELLEETREDAQRRGWTPLDDEDDAYELEGVVLRIAEMVRNGTPVLSVSFTQVWPAELGAPVETSETFQKMVREALSLGGEPSRLVKVVISDPLDERRIDELRETVELPLDAGLISRFPRIGFTYSESLEAWEMGSIFGEYDLRATVRESFDRVVVEVKKKRLRN
jgi:hypothetical protein